MFSRAVRILQGAHSEVKATVNHYARPTNPPVVDTHPPETEFFKVYPLDRLNVKERKFEI